MEINLLEIWAVDGVRSCLALEAFSLPRLRAASRSVLEV